MKPNFKKNTRLSSVVHDCNCSESKLLSNIYRSIVDLQQKQDKILLFILQKEAEETIYRDAVYAIDRVGISESTLLRCQRKGMIKVAKLERGKKFFRDQDVERLRMQYWGKTD
ncbi:hypothetical protein H8S90_10560 [Olivibacter sp. SDN3]|uniref:hypothetical protein n=1 Tax=Olivibacter sp. SDN3 TaxID=2764720 RepID=UPI0016510A1B|nr:hypothetical protein [Olivibacter sp. SDN3]QNL51972.1 hypothetical protein H8S90_10560 [Olivibacter sp. SDN3]